jgi:predicted ribosome quality control (RQC) complex YloA/Tae2 family protein
MNYYQLQQIIESFNNFTYLSCAKRINQNIIKLTFDKNKIYYFDMTKGSSYIFKNDEQNSDKIFSNSIDSYMQTNIKNSKILDIKTLESNKIVELKLQIKNAYKQNIIYIHFEFTGRHTNMIILNENFIILDALRYITSNMSSREILPNIKLKFLEKMDFKNRDGYIENIENYLYAIGENNQKKILNSLIKQKLMHLDKKIKKINKEIENLENRDKLLERSKSVFLNAQLLLENINQINIYQKKIELKNIQNKIISIELPNHAKTPAHAINILFDRSKKLKRKSNNIHLQYENLYSKLEFYKKLLSIVRDSNNTDEVDFYLPSRKIVKKKKNKKENYQYFLYNGFKIALGRNEIQNAYLLKDSKKDDIWFHMKDIPSSHVVIKTNKKNIPNGILKVAAKVCVDFSNVNKGSYLVDYTKRSNIKVVKGSNVLYVNNSTIKITKE